MIDETLDYRFLKIKNGKPFFAIVNLEVSPNENENEIIEEYIGEGWIGMGHFASIPAKDEAGKARFSDWRKAVLKGLELIFSKIETKWTVKVKKVEGLLITDTNPTIVGYAAILAFCEQINLKLDTELKKKIENFVFNSWKDKNYEKVPNFITLEYDL
ncbi:hypothetical protein [Flavobacterium mesophilum]|uniref:hypothetical protein n=1 Tax=Flavobacterium mesophilum TaxID=3143495 RepID=UPI0031D2FF14